MTNKNMVVVATSRNLPVTRIRSNEYEWEIDEPESFGGKASAPSPVEALLGAIASCVIAAGHWVSSEMEMEIKDIKVTVEGTIDSGKFLGIETNKRAGFQSLIINIDLNSDAAQDIKDKWLEEVIERCPVIDNLSRPVDIKVKFI